jgi:hypothetical protein
MKGNPTTVVINYQVIRFDVTINTLHTTVPIENLRLYQPLVAVLLF